MITRQDADDILEAIKQLSSTDEFGNQIVYLKDLERLFNIAVRVTEFRKEYGDIDE
jgi:hypothetical protein